MNTTVSIATGLVRSSVRAVGHIDQKCMRRRRSQVIWFAVALLLFAVDVQAASEAEVKVTGCVVDYGGQPYRHVEIELSGVNYKGGAGYTGNNSVTRTDERGEFTVRMKAGVPERPAQAKIRGTIEIYVTKGWTGGPTSANSLRGADVWPETLVGNIGKPVDLRPNGCIRFPYPITVLGTVTSENLYEQEAWPHRSSLTLRLSGDNAYLDMGTQIPVTRGITREIDFGVDLRPGVTYSVDIVKQPYSLGPAVPPTQKMCIQCDLVSGQTETIGLTPGGSNLTLVGGNSNIWATHSLQLQCRRKGIVKPDASCEAGEAKEDTEPADDTATVALPRKGAKSGVTQFQKAIAQAEQEERERPAREARERAAQARAAERVAEEERLASIKAAEEARAYEQEQARKNEQDARDTSAAIGALLGMGQQILQNKADRAQAEQGLGPCVPGYSYDAKLCGCQTNPRGAGCSGYVGGGKSNQSGSSSSGARGNNACSGIACN